MIMPRLAASSSVLDTPAQSPQWQAFPEQRNDLLSSLGFHVVRETNRFADDIAPIQEPASERLIFRSLPDVGTAAFLTAIEEVSVGTLDSLIQQHRTTLGAAGAAHELLRILQDMEYDPDWWQLAYTPSGDLVGLIMPTKSLTTGTIGYVGVVPARRGQGYGYDLLSRGTALLHAAGISTILADADAGNVPMAKAFGRAGYKEIGTRREYQLNFTF
jgi:RimJ/RimL family protein N-acetyltransferase